MGHVGPQGYIRLGAKRSLSPNRRNTERNHQVDAPSRLVPRSEVVPAAADCVTGHPEQGEDRADHYDDDADRPDDGDLCDEPDNEKNDAKNDQGNS
jgi:hypothetical protein